MARAFGSYPKCHRFKSSRRYQGLFSGPAWRVGQAAKTPPFHGGNTGSIPVRVTTDGRNRSRSYGGLAQLVRAPASHAGGHWFESSSLHQENPLEPQGSEGFFLPFGGGFPCFFPYSGFPLSSGNAPDKALHPLCAFPLHLLSHMTIDVQGKSSGGVSKVALHGLNVIPAFYRCHSIRVPLWHNKDKSENPCGATGWRFVLILFPLKSGLKMGSTGGGDKQGLHLKDKFSHANSSAIILCNSSHKLLICFGIVVHICLIPAIILPAYLRIENARTCTTSSLGIFFKVSR